MATTGLSVGMKLAELAEYFLGLGCTDAMNLDGGKSAQMWMNGRIMNSPCQGEDTVASSSCRPQARRALNCWCWRSEDNRVAAKASLRENLSTAGAWAEPANGL